MKKTYSFITYMFCITIFLSSCAKPKEIKPLKLNKAHEKFIKLCKDEFNLDVIVKPLKNTVWIYLPLKEDILDFKATPGKTIQVKEGKKTYGINFLETVYANNSFNIDYDISPITSYQKDLGYGSNLSEDCNLKYQRIVSAIKEVYFEVEEIQEEKKTSAPGQFPAQFHIVKKEEVKINPQAPVFFIITLTDINRGIEIEFILNLEDYKKQMIAYIPPDEAKLRQLYEMRGNIDSINDKEGNHIKIKELLMSEFLAKQITHRINFKYSKSDFPPSKETRQEILKQVYDAITAYEFQNYTEIKLKDLRDDLEFNILKEELDLYKKQPLPKGGKRHVIKFSL